MALPSSIRDNRPKRGSAADFLCGAKIDLAGVLRNLRTDYGLNQGLLVRLSGYSPRAIANWESGTKASEPAVHKFTELQRMFDAIANLTQDRREVAQWMLEPNEAFDGSTPLQVIERGETDRLWSMIHTLESGELG